MTPRTAEARRVDFDGWAAVDREAWRRGLEPQSPFQGGARPQEDWAAVTIEGAKLAYGRWLRWLRMNRPGADPRVVVWGTTEPNLRAYYGALVERGLADNTRATYLTDLARALTVMAPEQDWGWVKRAGSRIQSHAVLRWPKPKRRATDTLALGHDLMQSAEQDRYRSDLERAVLYRDGLIIAFLTHRPLRLKNLAALHLDRHIRVEGGRHAVLLPADETKTRRPLEFLWPEELEGQLVRYLDHYRPRLLQAGKGSRRQPTRALWVSRRGAANDQAAIADAIGRHTEAAFGERISPHKFRHIAATTVAIETPENVTDAARILGHATLASSEKHYNQARTADAALRYQKALGRR